MPRSVAAPPPPLHVPPCHWAPASNKILDRLPRIAHIGRVKPLQLQDAKQQFCAVAEKAAHGSPQIVTKHGKPYVVIVAVEEWRKVQPGRKTVLAALRACPADLTKLDLSRSQEGPRAVHL